MTQFCTRNIPTLFGMQFLSFVASVAENCFGRILTTFPGPGTGAEKVENRARKTRFCTRNIPTLFGVQFLSFLVSTAKKCFSRVLATFRVRALPEQEKLKTKPRWLGLVPETYPYFLGYNSYRFPSVRLNNVSVQFWQLFRGRLPPEEAQSRLSWYLAPGGPDFAPKTYPHCLGCRCYRLSSVLLKIVLVEFWQLLQARGPLKQVKWKTSPEWLSFTPETYPHSLWCSWYHFQSVVEKCFGRILTTFPDSGTTRAGKFENEAQKTQFCTRNILTIFRVQFLLFLVSKVEKCFGPVLTTFQVRALPEQKKLKT